MISLPNVQPIEKQALFDDGGLDVIEIFKTFQGEGPLAGTPAIFLRLAGCNLCCAKCFGIATKSRIPKIYTAYGPSVRLDKIVVGTKLLTFDKDLDLVETNVTSIIKRVTNTWLELQIANKLYDVTEDHPFFTTRGLISACELTIGDQILEAKPEEIIAYKKLGNKNPMTLQAVIAKKIANTDYSSMGKKVSQTIRDKQSKGIWKHPYELLTNEEYARYKEKARNSKLGDKNPMYKGEHPNLTRLLEKIKLKSITSCTNCEKQNTRLLVHHIDDNHDNDEIENLVVWCHQCHNRYHERGYNFWNGKRKDGKQLVKKHNGQEVQKITKCSGKLPVINISCAPYNTYIANGMWVHNCDTQYTKGRKCLSVLEISMHILELIGTSDIKLVVITGGEPFRQNINPLVTKLLYQDFLDVQIETNGTLYVELPTVTLGGLSVVCSPKTGSVNPKLKINAWKYIIQAGHVDPEDGLPTSVLGMECKVARPPQNVFPTDIFVQPMDEYDTDKNAANLKAAMESCYKHGYRLSLQTHKLLGVP